MKSTKVGYVSIMFISSDTYAIKRRAPPVMQLEAYKVGSKEVHIPQITPLQDGMCRFCR